MKPYALASAIALCLHGNASAQEALQPLPREVVDAWEKAGAKLRWLDPQHLLQLSPPRLKEQGAAGDLPVFNLLSGGKADFKALPVPESPSGVYFADSSNNGFRA